MSELRLIEQVEEWHDRLNVYLHATMPPMSGADHIQELVGLIAVMKDEMHAALKASASPVQAEPDAWLIDWPDKPELGHYFAEAPSDTGRSRPLYAHPPSGKDAEDADKARCYDYLLRKVCGIRGKGFDFVNLPPMPANWSQGSLAQHFDEAIRAAMSAEGSRG